MNVKKKLPKQLKGDATFKQTWKIAHNFAKQQYLLFPDYDLKKLAHLFNGTIYYYHEKVGKKLSKQEASELIKNDPPVPQYYIDELVGYDDLFLVCFYSSDPPSDPDSNGKLCTAHIVTLHRNKIYDTAKSGSYAVIPAKDYPRLNRQTKRIFRVVPLGHPRSV